MSAQPQPGWGPPPPPAKPKRRKAWHETWWIVGIIGFLVGLALASAADAQPKVQTSTEIKEQDVPTFLENCADYPRLNDVRACMQKEEDVQAAVRTTPTTAAPKPKPTQPPAPTFGDGLYEVGKEIKAGTYKTSGGESCYYARLRTDDTTSYIANNISNGPQTMRVRPTDGFVEFNGGCEWRKVSYFPRIKGESS